MEALNCSAGYSLSEPQLQFAYPEPLDLQRCGIVSVGNNRGVAPAIGYLSLALAEGHDLFGYSLLGTKYKVVLLTSPSREALFRKKLTAPIEKLETSGYLEIVNSSILTTLSGKHGSRNLDRCLDGVLGDAEIVIVDGYGPVDATDHVTQGFAPAGYEGALADYMFSSITERVSTIFVGQGNCAGAFKRWDPLVTFDHNLSLYRFDKKSEPLSFLVLKLKGHGASAEDDELMVSWRVKDDFGDYGWRTEAGLEPSDPLLEFAIHLRHQGMSYQRIGDLLGLGRSTVHRWLTVNCGMNTPRSR